MQYSNHEYEQRKCYIRKACEVSRWDTESNEDTYGRFSKSEGKVRMDCGVVEWVDERLVN